MSEETYKIVRFYALSAGGEDRETGLTLEEAQAHCNDPATSSVSGTGTPHPTLGDWFDGYASE